MENGVKTVCAKNDQFYESIVNNIMVFDIEKQIESFEKIYNEIGIKK